MWSMQAMRVDRNGRHGARAWEEHLCCCTSSCSNLDPAAVAAPIVPSTTSANSRAPFRRSDRGCCRRRRVGDGQWCVWVLRFPFRWALPSAGLQWMRRRRGEDTEGREENSRYLALFTPLLPSSSGVGLKWVDQQHWLLQGIALDDFHWYHWTLCSSPSAHPTFISSSFSSLTLLLPFIIFSRHLPLLLFVCFVLLFSPLLLSISVSEIFLQSAGTRKTCQFACANYGNQLDLGGMEREKRAEEQFAFLLSWKERRL